MELRMPPYFNSLGKLSTDVKCGPASSRRILRDGFSDSRAARTQPADPAPTIITSYRSITVPYELLLLQPFIDHGARLRVLTDNELRKAAISHLALSRLAPQLPDRFGLRIPALHVCLRKHPAGGVYRKLSSRTNALVLNELGRTALRAKAIILQGVE